MPSRFDIATGKAQEYVPQKRTLVSRPRRNTQEANFINRLKLVNESTGEEIRLANADFNLSVGASGAGGPMATISISISCPVREAQRFMSGK